MLFPLVVLILPKKPLIYNKTQHMSKQKRVIIKNKKKSQQEIQEEVFEMEQQQYNISRGSILSEIKVNIKCKTENQKKFLKLIRENEIIICSGNAGTGKTFLAISEALNLIKQNDSVYKKIVLIKSVTPLKGEEVGFLKGSIDEKMLPFMYSFMANFYKIIGKTLSDNLKEQNIIEVLPLAFIRGLSIDNAIIIIDEAQNVSFDNMESILTRIGENSKMIIIGDTKQIDIKNKKESSLSFISESFKNTDKFGIIEFSKEDQVRNPLINKIEEIFDKIKEKK